MPAQAPAKSKPAARAQRRGATSAKAKPASKAAASKAAPARAALSPAPKKAQARKVQAGTAQGRKATKQRTAKSAAPQAKTAAPRRRKITFGDITIYAPPPTAETLRKNLEHSAMALKGLVEALLNPGIRMRREKDIPLYYADDNYPGKFVRELNGKKEIGVLEGSTFVVTG